MRYRLSTLIVVLAILPPLLAVGWWSYAACQAELERHRFCREMVEALHVSYPLADITEPAEIYARLLPMAPSVGGVVAVALFVAVVVVALSPRNLAD